MNDIDWVALEKLGAESMSAIEKAMARDAKRIDPKVALKPTEVRTLSDIQRVVAEFAPGYQKDGTPVPVSGTMLGEDIEGKKQTYKVSATTSTKSRRTMIIEGLEIIKKYQDLISRSQNEVIPIEVNGKGMSPPALVRQDPAVHIDPIIKRWLGAKRRGLRLCWDLSDGYTYYYDIYNDKLSRAQRED